MAIDYYRVVLVSAPDPNMRSKELVLGSKNNRLRLIKLLASTMLSAAIKSQYSSVLPLLRHCLPVFGQQFCGTVMNSALLSSD